MKRVLPVNQNIMNVFEKKLKKNFHIGHKPFSMEVKTTMYSKAIFNFFEVVCHLNNLQVKSLLSAT